MTTAWTVEKFEVGQLVARMLDPQRDHPLVVVSPASDTGQPRIAPGRIAAELRDTACELAVLSSMETSNALSDAAPTNLLCYGGSIRIVQPGASVTDHWRANPLILVYPEDDEGATLIQLRSEVAAVGARPRPVRPARVTPARPTIPVPRPGPHLFRPATPTSPATPVASPGSPADPDTPPPTPPGPPLIDTVGLVSVETLTAALSDLEQRLCVRITDALIDLVGGTTSDDLARERSRADTAEQELDTLRDTHQRLLLAREQAARDTTPIVYGDPEQQLRWEIEQAWLTGAREPERLPLRPYCFGDGFLASLDHELVPRTKTISIMVDVLDGTVWTRRQCHQWLASAAGKQRVDDDGAVGWRVYVKANSPGAPRLHWWELPDGTVRFHQVGHHDDLI